MTVAFISIVNDSWGGSEVLWSETAKLCLKKNYKVIISKLDTGEIHQNFQELQRQGAILYQRRGYIKQGLSFKERVIKKGLNFAINKIINPFQNIFKHNPDIILYTGTSYSILDDISLFKLHEKNKSKLFILSQVGIEYGRPINDLESETLRHIFSKSEKIFFVSYRNLHTLERHICRRLNNAEIVRNPINLLKAEYLPFPKMSGSVNFAIVANLLVNHKGQDILFEALSSELWKERNWHLNLYGDGLDKKYLENLATFLGISDKITFHGKISEIKKVWEKNHALIMPSLSEGIPLAVVEAMISGRPIVATDVGGHEEWITDSVNGIITEGSNINSLRNGLERFWNMKDQWEIMGIQSYQIALRQYDPAPAETLLNFLQANQ